jgi:hypothetical protein
VGFKSGSAYILLYRADSYESSLHNDAAVTVSELWLPIEGPRSIVSSFATFLQSHIGSTVSVFRNWKLRTRVTCRSNYTVCHSGQRDAAADASVFADFEFPAAPPY